MRPNRYGDIDPAPTNGYMDGPCYQPPDLAYRASWVVPPSFLDGDEVRMLSVFSPRWSLFAAHGLPPKLTLFLV